MQTTAQTNSGHVAVNLAEPESSAHTATPTLTRLKDAVARLACGCIAKGGDPVVWSGNIARPAHHCVSHAESHYGMRFALPLSDATRWPSFAKAGANN